jgi:hypothetical protein
MERRYFCRFFQGKVLEYPPIICAVLDGRITDSGFWFLSPQIFKKFTEHAVFCRSVLLKREGYAVAQLLSLFMPLRLGVTFHAERLSACMELRKEAKRACCVASWHFNMLLQIDLT